MTTTEKLQAIRALCVELLAIAAKRTPGKWTIGDENNQHIEINIGDAVANLDRQDRYGLHMVFSRDEMRANGHFIISCAGPAEAGWRATIAAIDALERIQNNPSGATSICFTCEISIELILSAWQQVMNFPTDNNQ